MLDFDQTKQCSQTLETHNIYVCLTCGVYLRGKGPSTEAFTHSLEPQKETAANQRRNNKTEEQDIYLQEAEDHNLFIGVSGDNFNKIYLLPDNVEISGQHLSNIKDINMNLNPVLTSDWVSKIDSLKLKGRSLEGVPFIPGAVGLNNLKRTEFANAIIQMFNRVRPLRNYCLLQK